MYQNKARFFDDQSQASWAADPYSPQEMAQLDDLFARLGPLCSLRVLEPGCGTGRLTRILAERVGPQGHVTALDISAVMVARAWQRVGEQANVEIYVRPLEDHLGLPEEFDLILCHQVFPHLEDQQSCLKAFAHSLTSRGRLVIFHFIDLAEINDVHRKAGTAVENDLMPDRVTMGRLFQQAGFKITWLEEGNPGYCLIAHKVTHVENRVG